MIRRFGNIIDERVIEVADYVIETGATVRKCAEVFGVSKSTIHKDLVDRLPLLDFGRAIDARSKLNTNKEERHLRGGEATKMKFEALKAYTAK